ncbi:IMPACT family protein [Thermus filiformis]|uniref:IMPACT family member in pol 5'region n=1 Tax=Thermus filiformis TaxID=276 RepID=A0A0D6X9E3_THEFI|nr:YigZ family protein [Thermus filiformis]KIX84514.1 IMPACT family member in pol 5'region [Thermus filiformis]
MSLTLKAPVLHEEVIQKSRFIAKAAPVSSEEEALDFLRRSREVEATHNCYAYKIGNLYRFSDDGEPSGTAGRPILHAIEAQGLDRVAVLVVRYFGGVKLGASGLVRAYGGVAAEALRRGEKVPLVERVLWEFRVPYALAERVHRLVRPLEAHYDPQGVVFRVEVAQPEAEALRKALEEATRGRVEWRT